MTMQGQVQALAYTSRGDNRTRQYHIMCQTGQGICDMASRSNGNQQDVIGVLQNKPTSAHFASVGVAGEAKVYAGAAITSLNCLLTTNGSGRAVTAASGDWTIGTAQEAAANDGDIIRILLRLPAVRLTYTAP